MPRRPESSVEVEIGSAMVRPVSLFYSYSHRDEEFRSALETHLSFLRRNKLITEWHDRRIGGGGDWRGEIDRNLASADIVLLLVSADFIASDYCWDKEMDKALQRHERGEARVIILRRCQWHKTRLAKLQAVPKDGKPVASWADRDTAFDDVASAIERIIEELQEQRRRAAEQTLRRIPKPLPVPTLFINPSDIPGVTEIRWYRVPGASECVLERIESLSPFTTVEVYSGKPADKEIEWLCFHLQRHSTLLALDKPGEGCKATFEKKPWLQSHRVKAIAGPGDLNSDWSSLEDKLNIFKCC